LSGENVEQKSTRPKRMWNPTPKLLESFANHVELLHIANLVEEIPSRYSKIKEMPDAPEWYEAFKKEVQNMKDKQVWDIVKLDNNMNPIKTITVFTKKVNVNGTMKYKARIVAQGFRQEQYTQYDK
jgi:hypothetical protein